MDGITSLDLASLELGRPAALAWLVVPLVVAWLAARSRAPLQRRTGTVEIWREVARETAAASASRRSLPWSLVLLLAALTAASAALAEPRVGGGVSAATWRVIVDRSPSMYLPLDGRNGPTRLSHGLDLARSELRRAGADAKVLWIAASGDFATEHAGVEPPPEWLAPPRGAWSEPRWDLHDRAGTLWVTDRAPASRLASAVESGGAAVPGLVAARPDGTWHWNGSSVERRSPGENGGTTVAASIDPRLAGGDVERAFDAWTRARGLSRAEFGAPAQLELRAAVAGEAFESDVGRDGWSASATCRAVRPSTEAPSEFWLAATGPGGEIVDVVRSGPGEIVVGLDALADLRGDPAAFAVSWAELFDRAFAPRGVGVSERAAAGAEEVRSGADPDRTGGRDTALSSALGLAAAILALGSLLGSFRGAAKLAR